MNEKHNDHENPSQFPAQAALAVSDANRESQSNNEGQASNNGHVPQSTGYLVGAAPQANDYIGNFQKQADAAQKEAERRKEAAFVQFQEESIRRGFGLRTPAPIRSEEIKAQTYRLGYWFAMIFATILGIVNANQTIDLYGIELDWTIKLTSITVAVAFTLFAFKHISKSYLTATVDLSSFQNRGAREIKRWFKKLGLLFFLIALPSLFLRMDTGLPEVIGIVFFILWEFVTVMIAALAAIAFEYHSWSGDLAKDYEEAIASLN